MWAPPGCWGEIPWALQPSFRSYYSQENVREKTKKGGACCDPLSAMDNMGKNRHTTALTHTHTHTRTTALTHTHTTALTPLTQPSHSHNRPGTYRTYAIAFAKTTVMIFTIFCFFLFILNLESINTGCLLCLLNVSFLFKHHNIKLLDLTVQHCKKDSEKTPRMGHWRERSVSLRFVLLSKCDSLTLKWPCLYSPLQHEKEREIAEDSDRDIK